MLRYSVSALSVCSIFRDFQIVRKRNMLTRIALLYKVFTTTLFYKSMQWGTGLIIISRQMTQFLKSTLEQLLTAFAKKSMKEKVLSQHRKFMKTPTRLVSKFAKSGIMKARFYISKTKQFLIWSIFWIWGLKLSSSTSSKSSEIDP